MGAILNKEWMATLSAPDFYLVMNWLTSDYGTWFPDPDAAIVEWLDDIHELDYRLADKLYNSNMLGHPDTCGYDYFKELLNIVGIRAYREGIFSTIEEMERRKTATYNAFLRHLIPGRVGRCAELTNLDIISTLMLLSDDDILKIRNVGFKSGKLLRMARDFINNGMMHITYNEEKTDNGTECGD